MPPPSCWPKPAAGSTRTSTSPIVRQVRTARVAAALAGAVATTALAAPARAGAQDTAAATVTRAVRVNQVGYLPSGVKVAVVCSLDSETVRTFVVTDSSGRTVLGPRR